MLALAHHVERQIGEGAIPDYASAASALGVTRARLSQVMSLLLLAPKIQERIALGEIAASERDLRAVVALPLWANQQRELHEHLDASAADRSTPETKGRL